MVTGAVTVRLVQPAGSALPFARLFVPYRLIETPVAFTVAYVRRHAIQGAVGPLL